MRTMAWSWILVLAAAPAAFALEGEAPRESTKTLEERVAELEKLVKKDQGGLSLYWKNGIRMDSADGNFKLKVGGRIQNDWSWFNHQRDFENALIPPRQIEAGTEFRRARLAVGGTIYRDFDFMAEYDFAQGTAKFREVWMGMKLGDASRVWVGSVKEPFGLEEMVSDLFTTFIERSAPDEAFCPVYNTGALFMGTLLKKRMAWAAGVFRDANDFGDDTANTTSGEYAVTARLAGRPFVAEGGKRFLHVGAAGSYREPSNGLVQFRARPELHLVPQMVDTGAFAANSVHLWELEAAQAWDSFTAIVEWFQADVVAPGATDPNFHGMAAQASYLLTGEGRPYNEDKAAFDRVIPKVNAGKGRGAWEAAARWSRLDLDSSGVNGGVQTVWTVGVNWYLNPNMKIQFDHVRAHVNDVGNLYAWVLRFQVDF